MAISAEEQARVDALINGDADAFVYMAGGQTVSGRVLATANGRTAVRELETGRLLVIYNQHVQAFGEILVPRVG